MSKATESMFDGKDVLIPLAEVSYILKFPSCIEVHFKGSAESVTLVQPDQNALISAWCRYRSEVEADTLMDLDGAQPAPSVPECPYPCGWKNLLTYAIKDGAYLARAISEGEPVTENARSVTMRMVMRLRDVLMALNNARPDGWLRAIDEDRALRHKQGEVQ